LVHEPEICNDRCAAIRLPKQLAVYEPKRLSIAIHTALQTFGFSAVRELVRHLGEFLFRCVAPDPSRDDVESFW
jgi:hypothetical protein